MKATGLFLQGWDSETLMNWAYPLDIFFFLDEEGEYVIQLYARLAPPINAPVDTKRYECLDSLNTGSCTPQHIKNLLGYLDLRDDTTYDILRAHYAKVWKDRLNERPEAEGKIISMPFRALLEDILQVLEYRALWPDSQEQEYEEYYPC